MGGLFNNEKRVKASRKKLDTYRTQWVSSSFDDFCVS